MNRYESIPDPTEKNLSHALLDQQVAGAFMDKDYAYVPVTTGSAWSAGIAVANEEGYHPIDGLSFPSHEQASTFCNGMNKHIGLPADHATGIICSTMGGRSYRR